MANKKISDLTSGSALGGTEELPIVQSSTTVKTTINAIKTFLNSVFVPYTGATQDTDLGNYSLNAKSLNIKGTAGTGHLGLKHQSSNITANASESSLGADSSGNPVWKNDGNAIESIELQTNKTSTVTGNETSTVKYPTIKGMYDWAVGLFVKKGTLTTNYIPKATASDTIGNSTQYYDINGNLVLGDGSKAVSTNGLYPLYSGFGNSFETGYLGVNNDISVNGNLLFKGSGFTKIYAGVSNDLYYYSANKHYFLSTTLNIDALTASQIVETDASKNLISAAKGTAYNKNFGTTAGTVLEGDKGLLIANNLSDLSNPLTARNNLKEWDLYITSGNQSTTSATATNITDLVSPTLTTNKLYDFEGHIYVSCNNTGGVKFQITIPTGATITACFDGSIGSNSTFQSAIVLASATLTGFSFIQFNGSNIIKVKGQVLLGSTAGTIQFGFASGIAGQTSTVNQLGTHIKLTQLN